MDSEEIEKLKKDNKELFLSLNSLLDYTFCMKMTTRYTTPGEPNLLQTIKLINRIRRDYFEAKRTDRA